ncbi:aldehyde dehydrogenase family protein [Streptomyces sp. NPDC054786]
MVSSCGRVRLASPRDAEYLDGAYCPPTALARVPDGSGILTAELFGPVATVQVFDAEEGLHLPGTGPFLAHGEGGDFLGTLLGRAALLACSLMCP